MFAKVAEFDGLREQERTEVTEMFSRLPVVQENVNQASAILVLRRILPRLIKKWVQQINRANMRFLCLFSEPGRGSSGDAGREC